MVGKWNNLCSSRNDELQKNTHVAECIYQQWEPINKGKEPKMNWNDPEMDAAYKNSMRLSMNKNRSLSIMTWI